MTEAAQAPAAPEQTAETTKQESATPTPPAPAAPESKQADAPAQTPEAVRNPDARIKALEEQAERFKRQRDEARGKLEGTKSTEERLAELEQANALLRARDVLRSAGINDDEIVDAVAPGLLSAEDPKSVAAKLAEKLKPKAVIAPRAPSNGSPAPAAGWEARLAQRVKGHGS